MAKKIERRHYKVHSLPPELREAVDELILQGVHYRDIAAFLRERGHEIGKSSVARYGKDFLARLERVKLIRDQARAILEAKPDAPATELAEAASLLAQQLIMETLMKLDNVDGEKVSSLLLALAKLEQSGVARERLKLEYRAKAESVVSRLHDEELAGKSPEEIRELIRRRIREEYGG